MQKLGKQYYYTSDGSKKVNCYKINIPKEVVDKTNIDESEIRVYAKDNKIIIEKAEA